MLVATVQSLALSLVVAVSPMPVTAALLMLPTGEQQRNRAPALLLGWALAILLLALVVVLVPGLESQGGAPTRVSGYLKLALGIALTALGIRQWILRPPPGTEPETPLVFKKLSHINFYRAVFIGAILLAANPKNLVLVAAAANILDTSYLNVAEQMVALILFTAGASSTIAVPVIGYWLFRDRARLLLGRGRGWLLRHNDVVASTLLVIFGMLLLASGITILLNT